MRHRNIETTMDYYANGDEAVMAAVLGAERNRLRNSQPAGEGHAEPTVDASRKPGTSFH
jgi:hypothetical protein